VLNPISVRELMETGWGERELTLFLKNRLYRLSRRSIVDKS
jgi:hypothetical protein